MIEKKRVDLRKGHDGLATNVLGLNPHSGLNVVFRSERRDGTKALLWDGQRTGVGL